jgi:uncharacterized protein (DUF1330 family)
MSAYIVVDMRVADPHEYQKYARAAEKAVAQYGGRYLVRGGNPRPLEGEWQPTRIVVLEFPDAEQARRWYDSPEYQEAKALRSGCAEGSFILVDGYEH